MTQKQIVATLVTTKQTNLGQVGAALVKAGFKAARSF